MEEKKPGSMLDGTASPKPTTEETRKLAPAAQNGEQTPATEAEKGSFVRRPSSISSEPGKMEGGWKGVISPEEPLRKRFQIPRKSREKKALQPISTDSREFEEILKILHSTFLESNSKIHFAYKSARLVHNEFLEKEFHEKRRQLKYEGRQEKELAESYAFLLVDEPQVQTICEKGLLIGHSKITTLGKSSMGVYLSRYADLLQANPLEAGATGSIFIFKVIKGKMKFVFDNFRNNQDSYSGNVGMDPAPKHECHVLKNMNAIKLLSYRAFERTQYYFYEYGFDEILKRPRHVCPYAVLTFGYKTDQPRPSLPPSGSASFSSDRYNDRNSFIMWRGQLLCNGKLLCFASLKSTNGPFFPYKLPEKLDLEILIQLEEVKKKIPPLLFYKETHVKAKEVVKGGIFSRLYEVCDKTRIGNDFQALVQKLEKEKLALVKKMPDKGFLFFYFPTPMTTSYGSYSSKPYPLHALFIYQQSRAILQHASQFKVQPTIMPENHENIPELMTLVVALHYALYKAQSDTSDDFNIVVEKHVRLYLKRRAEGSYKHRQFVLKEYEQNLDGKKNLYVAPREKNRIHTVLKSYLHGSEAYTLLVARGKELLQENQKVQQFSPISDYEPVEDDHDTQISPKQEKQAKTPDNADYDPDQVNRLLSLIQLRKSASTSQEADETPSHSGLKRKIESSAEKKWKHPKYEDYFHRSQEEPVDSLITALGGQDTDLREEEEEEMEAEPEATQVVSGDVEYCKGLFEKLSNSGLSGLLDSIKPFLPGQIPSNDEASNSDFVASGSTDPELSMPYDQSTCVNPQTANHPETSVALHLPPVDEVAVQKADDGSDPLAIEEMIQGPYSGYASPCPSTPTEEVTQQEDSYPSSEDSQMNWKLIPITGEEGRVPEDHVGYLRDEKQQGLNLAKELSAYFPHTKTLPNDPRVQNVKRRSSGYSPLEEYQKRRRRSSSQIEIVDYPAKKGRNFLKTYHCQEGVIENTVLEIYNNFSERLQDVLREKDISYTTVTLPVLSSDERSVRLSEWLYAQASGIAVQEYVDELRVKLNYVVNSFMGSPEMDRPVNRASEIQETRESSQLVNQPNSPIEPIHHSRNANSLKSSELFHNGCAELPNSLQDGSLVFLAESVAQTSQDAETEDQEKASSPDDMNASHTGLAHLINQMNPEVFNNLVKIFTHVNKNIVKFYIHAEQEDNAVCNEIKDYLIKLGNVQCSPEEFVNSDSGSDKLLIIIQNEEIASSIHTIPSLMTLKRKSCVSFAGIDNLEDLKNHTYNELFVSGGFIVSDDTVLNPDTISDDVLKRFLMFLEEIDNPDGKWQWKVHCKFQKKLKEIARVNKAALNILNLLNTYQKKHLVEILSYHNCDSQSRQAPELDCLIKLQAQNIQQRHLIFLTEKSTSLFPSHAESGIVVTSMEEFILNFTDLVGHHNASNEEHCISQLVNQEKLEEQTAVSEVDVKEEEDMSLDSEDEMPQIEVCTNKADSEPHIDGTLNQSEAVEDSKIEESKNKTPIIDPECMQPVTPVSVTKSTTCDNRNVTEDSLNSFDDYDSKLGISHFNLLTHQTFLGSMVYGSQMPVESLFSSSYNQSVEQETSSRSDWD